MLWRLFRLAWQWKPLALAVCIDTDYLMKIFVAWIFRYCVSCSALLNCHFGAVLIFLRTIVNVFLLPVFSWSQKSTRICIPLSWKIVTASKMLSVLSLNNRYSKKKMPKCRNNSPKTVLLLNRLSHKLLSIIVSSSWLLKIQCSVISGS